jgi:hypothetical protein
MVSKYEFVTKDGSPALPTLRKFMTEVKRKIAKAEVLILATADELSREAALIMADRVRAMTKRKGATGELADALEKSVKVRLTTKKNFIIDVGDSSTLPEYWAMINYGGYIQSGWLYGFWSDGETGKSDYSKRGGLGRGEFFPTGKSAGGTVMVPRRPIKGFQYIAYGHSKMLQLVKRRFSNFWQKV